MILNSPYISGSLTVTGNIIASGSITISGSIASASYASNAERVDGLDSTSFVFTSSFNTYSSSISTRETNLESTASVLTTASASFAVVSGSYSSASGSLSTRVTKIEGNYATTGSNVFMGAQTVCANITSTGTIIAQTLNVQQVTSSIVYSSGSNTFGCLTTDRQQFTGSVTMTGSLAVFTAGTSPEFQVVTGGTIKGNALTDVHQVTGSLRVTGSGPHFIEAGCLGIGTTTPQRLVHVTSNTENGIYLSCNSSQLVIGNNHTLASKTCSTTIALAGANTDYFPTSCAGDTIIATQAGSILFGTGMNAGVASGTERFRITNTGIAVFTCQICTTSAALSANIIFNRASTSAGNNIEWRTASTLNWYIGTRGLVNNNFYFVNEGLGANNLILDATSGTATFACQVCAPQFIGGFICGTGGFRMAGATTTWSSISFTPDNPGGGGGQCKTVLAARIDGCTGHGPQIRFSGATSGEFIDIGQDCNGGFVIEGTDNPRLTVQNCGNVGIGTTSPQLNTNNGRFLTVQSSVGSGWLELATSTTTDGLGGALSFNNTNRTGTDKRIAQIAGIRDGANDTGALTFVTWNAGTGAERMRITSGGSINLTTGISGPRLFSYCSDMCNLNGLGLDMAGCSYEFGLFFAYGTSDNGRISFGSYQQTCYRSKMIILGNGNIGVPGNATAIYNASDCRLKNNIEPLNYGLAQVMCINPVKFNWKCEFLGEECSRNNFGFIAQEVQSVLPDLVEQFGGSEVILSDGTVVDHPLRINEKNLTALLVKAIQELKCQNDIFKTCLGIG